nr:MAG TPA: hypothetical protein [Caudoviricetes sp.]
MWKTHKVEHVPYMNCNRTIHCNTNESLPAGSLVARGGGCVIYTNIVVTQRSLHLGKPVASKQPTCVESKREVNKMNGRLTETVRGWHGWDRHHTPITHRISTADAPHMTRPHLLVEGRAS